MDVPTEGFKEVFHDGIMVILTVDGFQDIEFFLLTGIFVPFEQLKEDVGGIDKVLALIVPIFLIIEIGELIKVMEELILQMTDIGGGFSGELMMNEDNVLVVLGVFGFFEKKEDVLLGDFFKRLFLGRFLVILGDEVMELELFDKIRIDLGINGRILLALILIDTVLEMSPAIVLVLIADVDTINVFIGYVVGDGVVNIATGFADKIIVVIGNLHVLGLTGGAFLFLDTTELEGLEGARRRNNNVFFHLMKTIPCEFLREITPNELQVLSDDGIHFFNRVGLHDRTHELDLYLPMKTLLVPIKHRYRMNEVIMDIRVFFLPNSFFLEHVHKIIVDGEDIHPIPIHLLALLLFFLIHFSSRFYR